MVRKTFWKLKLNCRSSKISTALIYQVAIQIIDKTSFNLNCIIKITFLKDPLFIYANMNEINFIIRDELVFWLNYKPIRGDDELLNLLILELFEDSMSNQLIDLPPENKTYKTKQLAFTTESSSSSSFIHQPNLSSTSIKSMSSHSTIKSLHRSKTSNQETTMASDLTKPTLIDTYYDLLKSFHLHITINSVKINLINQELVSESLNSSIVINLPRVDIKSIGTKCDLEEELKSSKLIELPLTYLRACEKTSDKLPWLIDLKDFQVYYKNNYNDYLHTIVPGIDLNSVFSLKPKYHQYDNLLSSLSVVFNVDVSKKIDINLKQAELELIVGWSSLIERTLLNFKQRIDYEEFEAKINYDVEEPCEARSGCDETSDWDDTKSFSSISISKEYDLIALNELDESDNKETESEVFAESDRLMSAASSDDVSSNSSASFINKEKAQRQYRLSSNVKRTKINNKEQSDSLMKQNKLKSNLNLNIFR